VTVADITVAIATVDRPASLARCAAAMLQGRVLPRELIVVDQSADAATEDVVGNVAATAAVPVRYMRQLRRGLAASRNLALTYATSACVAFTDDDCVPEDDWVAQIAHAFEVDPQLAAVTGRILPLGPDRPGLFAVSSRPSTMRRTYRGRALPWAVGSGANTAVRREWLRRIGGFDETLGAAAPGRAAEDTDLLYRLLRAGAHVLYEPSAIVYHERQDRARRLATRSSYGFGLGAFCGKWARRGDAYAIWMLGQWLLERARPLAGSIARVRPQRLREELLMLGGAARGLAYGVSSLPGQRECLSDRLAGSSSSA
jgi:GT2 family glycosyltransferase